ncbi:MAG TPA: 50S ribosomal protein L11 methyltransferase [Polyangiaceae bacterium]|nr:50S ribosomal protein L11 methyltransferase [Polyangiaceae bacterium]
MTEKKPSYWFVAVDVTADEVDEASGRFFELGAEGVEERDEGTLVKGAAGKVTLVASFPTKAKAEAAKKKTKDARIEELVGDEWRDAWKAHFKPFRLCEGVWVRPPWEEHVARRNEKVLVLEPGRAFGTGLHETTRLVAESIAMMKRGLAATSVLDVGTGSGILALVALALGAKDAIGIDNDPDVIDVATENAARNGMQKKATFSATPLAKVKGKFGVVLANIEADVLIAMHKQLRAHLAFGGRLVLSGILEARESDVRATFGKPISRVSLGEWVALVYAL